MLKGATEEIRCAASHVIFRLAARGDIEARGPAECPAFKKCIHRKRQLKNSRKIYLIYYIYIVGVYYTYNGNGISIYSLCMYDYGCTALFTVLYIFSKSDEEDA